MMKVGRFLVFAVGVTLMLASAAHAADTVAVWEKNCASCHGKDGKGDTKAGKMTKVKDLTAPDVRATLKADEVRKTIEQGVVDKDTGKSRMKAYKDKLSSGDIDALVKHVLELGGAK